MDYQLELFVEFDEILKQNTTSFELDIEFNTVIIKMEINEQFKGIGDYLINQCFCHTESRPLIVFRYNDGYNGYAKYDVPQHDIDIDENFVYFRVPFSKWLDISSASFGGMYG